MVGPEYDTNFSPFGRTGELVCLLAIFWPDSRSARRRARSRCEAEASIKKKQNLPNATMKIILSRKGFDSAAGGCASPIYDADSKIMSLPIPIAGTSIAYQQINFAHENIGALVEGLSGGKIKATDTAHVDPDLEFGSLNNRAPNWRPSFGQSAAAQSHLSRQGVKVGDLFLFFGWFKEVAFENYDWKFMRNAPDRHVIFGWLQIADILIIQEKAEQVLVRYPWLKDHPHLGTPEIGTPNNVIYIASEKLNIPGMPELLRFPGGGSFSHLTPHRILTKRDQKSRSVWRLPAFFHPSRQGQCLTYHGNLDRWSAVDEDNETTELQTVGRGQEFVQTWSNSSDERKWLRKIFI